jgi:hypothetical protein
MRDATKRVPLFPLGTTVATRGIIAAEVDPFALLRRHQCGDWGDLGPDDKQLNERALQHKERLFSAYDTPAGKVYVITEYDRSLTTVLLAGEY